MGDGLLHAHVSQQLSAQRRHAFILDTTRHNVPKPGQVRVAVQGETVRRDVATAADPCGAGWDRESRSPHPGFPQTTRQQRLGINSRMAELPQLGSDIQLVKVDLISASNNVLFWPDRGRIIIRVQFMVRHFNHMVIDTNCGCAAVPMAQILFSPTQTPVCCDVAAAIPNLWQTVMTVFSSSQTYQRRLCQG